MLDSYYIKFGETTITLDGTQYDISLEYDVIELIQCIIYLDNPDIVKTIIDSGIEIDFSTGDNMILNKSINYERLKIANYVIDNDIVNVSDNDNIALRLATRNGHYDIVKKLLDIPGVDPNVRDDKFDYPICIAIKRVDYRMAKILIDHESVDTGIADDRPYDIACNLSDERHCKYMIGLLQMRWSRVYKL